MLRIVLNDIPEYERLAVSWPKEGMWSVCLPLALGSVKSVSAS